MEVLVHGELFLRGTLTAGVAIIGASDAAHHIGCEGAIILGIALGTVRRFLTIAAFITVKRTISTFLRSNHIK